MQIKIKDLKLGDRVRLGDYPFADAVVRQIETDANYVTLFRPYAVTADFSYTGGVIPYIGTEEVKLWMGDKEREIELLDRKDLK